MKNLGGFVLSLAAIAVAFSMTSRSVQADLINGGFEVPLNVVSPGSDNANQNFVDYYSLGDPYATGQYNSYLSSFLGWTVTGSVDIVNASTNPYGWDGFGPSHQSLDLNGWGPGSISQTFYVAPGQATDLFFVYANNPWNGGNPGMDVTISGVGTFHYDHTGSTLADMLWVPVDIPFVGNGVMTVTFSSTTGGTGGIALDAVSVPVATPLVAVPEPSTMALAGIGLALFAIRRRRAAAV